jgi:hypothetical protein
MPIRGSHPRGAESGDPYDAYRDRQLEEGGRRDRPMPEWRKQAERDRANKRLATYPAYMEGPATPAPGYGQAEVARAIARVRMTDKELLEGVRDFTGD